MSKPFTGGPAYPESCNGQIIPGMRLRDWFAGQALASMTVPPDYHNGPCNALMADRAYAIADEMIKKKEASNE